MLFEPMRRERLLKVHALTPAKLRCEFEKEMYVKVPHIKRPDHLSQLYQDFHELKQRMKKGHIVIKLDQAQKQIEPAREEEQTGEADDSYNYEYWHNMYDAQMSESNLSSKRVRINIRNFNPYDRRAFLFDGGSLTTVHNPQKRFKSTSAGKPRNKSTTSQNFQDVQVGNPQKLNLHRKTLIPQVVLEDFQQATGLKRMKTAVNNFNSMSTLNKIKAPLDKHSKERKDRSISKDFQQNSIFEKIIKERQKFEQQKKGSRPKPRPVTTHFHTIKVLKQVKSEKVLGAKGEEGVGESGMKIPYLEKVQQQKKLGAGRHRASIKEMATQGKEELYDYVPKRVRFVYRKKDKFRSQGHIYGLFASECFTCGKKNVEVEFINKQQICLECKKFVDN